ncbi:MAG TPA: hypothetical protein VIJ63_00825 [Roseiarcus sp.]
MKNRGGQGGGDCLERWDFGLAKEIARVEQAARDWGVHVDAAEGRFVGALLKAIEETGKTNLAALGDLEVLFEKARREGEADRRRIERMVEAGVNALAMAHRAAENAGVASAHAQQMIDESVAGIQKRVSKGACRPVPAMVHFRADGPASAVCMATGGLGRRRGRGVVHCRRRYDAMLECEGERGAASRARSGRPLWG